MMTLATTTANYGLAQKVALLRDPRVYPQPPREIETVETHMSWVFLTETYAYKLKKPVRYPYLDFSTLAAREWNCREELRLNQALAPDVYLGVVPLAVEVDDAVRVEGQGAIIEWLVKMRRLPAERMLDRLIRSRELRPEEIERLARTLIGFYRKALPVGMTSNDYRAQFAQMIDLNRAVLAQARYGMPAEAVARVHDTLSRVLSTNAEMFNARTRNGLIVEGHGDLRPEHVCLEEQPVVFDRLEFNRAFRLVDPVDELSYLGMECDRLGSPQIGHSLFDAYLVGTGDDAPQALRLFYRAHRACVRARLAVLHIDELQPGVAAKWLNTAREYLRLAHTYCEVL